MQSVQLADYTYEKFKSAGLSPFLDMRDGSLVLRATLPVLGVVYLDFTKDTVNLSGMEGKGVYGWLRDTIFPHIRVKHNGQVYSALEQFLWKRFHPDDIKVRLGVNDAIVLITWNYVKYSSEHIEPAIREFCEPRGRTYDLDDDRFYVNITEVYWQ